MLMIDRVKGGERTLELSNEQGKSNGHRRDKCGFLLFDRDEQDRED